jgi:hypothetical protein
MVFFVEEKTLFFLHLTRHFTQSELAGFQVTISGWF